MGGSKKQASRVRAVQPVKSPRSPPLVRPGDALATAADVVATATGAGVQYRLVGAWLSLVEHSVRDRGVGGSNPLAPTTSYLPKPQGNLFNERARGRVRVASPVYRGLATRVSVVGDKAVSDDGRWLAHVLLITGDIFHIVGPPKEFHRSCQTKFLPELRPLLAAEPVVVRGDPSAK